MNKKTVSELIFLLLLTSTLTLAVGTQLVRANGTIYIRPDGTVEGTDKIQRDGDAYTFTNNIYSTYNTNGIVVEKDSIVIDGAGYTLGAGGGTSGGIALSGRSNVTVKNTTIRNFYLAVELYHSVNNAVSGNTITNSSHYSVYSYRSANNTVSGNTITDNDFGIRLGYGANFNAVSGNAIANNWYGIWLHSCSDNRIYHNNFINNTQQAYSYVSGYDNFWDDGYPSGGNYWSDYEERYPDATEMDDSGIWDTTYVIDESNQDNYPLIELWTPPPPIPTTIAELKSEIEELGAEGQIDNQGVVVNLLTKLDGAQGLVDKGRTDKAKRILKEGFISQIQNLSGIHITVETADLLIESAEYILAHL